MSLMAGPPLYAGQFFDVEEKQNTETISKVLYPNPILLPLGQQTARNAYGSVGGRSPKKQMPSVTGWTRIETLSGTKVSRRWSGASPRDP